MVVQSIALLDDLDKEINIYSMRVKVRYMPLICRRDFFNVEILHHSRNGTDGISLKWGKS